MRTFMPVMFQEDVCSAKPVPGLAQVEKVPHKFPAIYKAHWGNTLYGRTKGPSVEEAGVVQRLKMANRCRDLVQ